jgi:hypothetical protein
MAQPVQPLFFLVILLTAFIVAVAIVRAVVTLIIVLFTTIRGGSGTFIFFGNGFKAIQEFSAGAIQTLFMTAFFQFAQIEQLDLIAETLHRLGGFFSSDLDTVSSLVSH